MPFLIFRKRSLCVCLMVAAAISFACGRRSVEVSSTAHGTPAEHAININPASVDELTRIPHIGEKLAAKIVEHREENGPFRRVEHLMLIRGVSDKRFRKIQPLVRVE